MDAGISPSIHIDGHVEPTFSETHVPQDTLYRRHTLEEAGASLPNTSIEGLVLKDDIPPSIQIDGHVEPAFSDACSPQATPYSQHTVEKAGASLPNVSIDALVLDAGMSPSIHIDGHVEPTVFDARTFQRRKLTPIPEEEQYSPAQKDWMEWAAKHIRFEDIEKYRKRGAPPHPIISVLDPPEDDREYISDD